MSLGIDTGTALNSLASFQRDLSQAGNQASSGKKLTTAAVDPSGVAIYNALTQQAQGDDQANENIANAGDAINVTQGAASSIGSALSQLSSLAVEAGNGFLSNSDRAALQDQANQLVQQINTVASTTNFNGTATLDGSASGTTPATGASSTITSDDLVNAGGNVVTSATPSATTTDGTINVQIANTGSGAVANVTFTDSATQTVTAVGSFSAGSTTTVNGTSITFGNFTASDTNATATIQTTAATAGSVAPAAQVQSGAGQGQTTTVSFANDTTSGLGISNIDFSTTANATNAQGQINAAIVKLGTSQAQLGAQSSALGNAFQNNNISSVNLTNSASDIGDTREASVASELNSLQIQQQISIQTINNANAANGYLNRFFNVSA